MPDLSRSVFRFEGLAKTINSMCLACDTNVNTEQLDEFSARYLEVLNHGALCLMISIGHRTGLFLALRRTGPCTAVQLAAASHLNERYVREWLGAMVAGKIVEINDELFALSETAAQLFANEDEASNIAYLSQYIGMLGEVETHVVDCFYKGGGVPYSAFSRFHDVMAEDSGQNIVATHPDHILPLVPGLTSVLQEGINVLDIGCGRGRALHLLAEKFPKSRFTGCDLSDEAIAYARDRANDSELRNLRFEVRDLTTFDREASEAAYDLITAFDAIHDQARPCRNLPKSQTGRRFPYARYSSFKQHRGKPGSSSWDTALHDLVHALHDDVTFTRWDGSGRNVGRTMCTPILEIGGLHEYRNPHARTRHPEQLLRGEEETTIIGIASNWHKPAGRALRSFSSRQTMTYSPTSCPSM